MRNRVVHVEVDDRTLVDTDGLNRGLAGLARQAEDSCDFEEILNCAIQSLYIAQPQGGFNYAGKCPRVGYVWLCRFNNEEGPGKTDITYTPLGKYKEMWRYIHKKIGTIDLRGKTYSVAWNSINDSESGHQIPDILMKDTEAVMECLGLTKKVR